MRWKGCTWATEVTVDFGGNPDHVLLGLGLQLGGGKMCDNKTVKQVFGWEPSSRRSRGRPKKRWMDCVKEDLHRAEISRYGITTGRQRVSLREIAGDRSQKRELVAASTAETSFVMTP